MRSLRSRFIFSHLLPILLIVPLVTIILLYLLETQILLTDMSEDITEKADLIAQTVNGRPELLQNRPQAESFLAGVSIYIDEGILLINPQGNVIASSEILADEMDVVRTGLFGVLDNEAACAAMIELGDSVPAEPTCDDVHGELDNRLGAFRDYIVDYRVTLRDRIAAWRAR